MYNVKFKNNFKILKNLWKIIQYYLLKKDINYIKLKTKN